MDKDSIDRIRAATFPITRRGYDKREVERFLGKLADWLERGGGDESRADLIQRELDRVGAKTARILSAAEAAAEELREDGAADAGALLARARGEAARMIQQANRRRADIEAEVAALEQRCAHLSRQLERQSPEPVAPPSAAVRRP